MNHLSRREYLRAATAALAAASLPSPAYAQHAAPDPSNGRPPIAMAAPSASMVVSTSQDPLFPPEGQEESARQIRAGYKWAACPEKFGYVNPPKPHSYDAELQVIAVDWFDRHLKADST
jgi:hypothetical protein